MTWIPERGINGFPSRTASTLAFDAPTRTVTLTPASADGYILYVDNRQHRIETAISVQWPNTTGLFVAYIDHSLTLQLTTSVSAHVIQTWAMVATWYWNAETGELTHQADERHGLMPASLHSYLHRTRGAQLNAASSLGIFSVTALATEASGDLATSAQIGLTGGELVDEDLELTSTETGQALDLPAQIPVLYRFGAAGAWRKKAATTYPLVHEGTAGYGGARAPYNSFLAGTWGFTEIANNSFGLVHILAWNDTTSRVVAIQGQNAYASVALARDGAQVEIRQLKLDGLPTLEWCALYTLVFQTSSSYSNVPHIRWRFAEPLAYVDWRQAAPAAGSPTPVTATAEETVSLTPVCLHPGASAQNVGSGFAFGDLFVSLWYLPRKIAATHVVLAITSGTPTGLIGGVWQMGGGACPLPSSSIPRVLTFQGATNAGPNTYTVAYESGKDSLEEGWYVMGVDSAGGGGQVTFNVRTHMVSDGISHSAVAGTSGLFPAGALLDLVASPRVVGQLPNPLVYSSHTQSGGQIATVGPLHTWKKV